MSNLYLNRLLIEGQIEDVRFDATIFEGQCRAHKIAVTHNCDVKHSVYNSFLRKWDSLCTYHADGTATNAFGERRIFTGDRMRSWCDIENTTTEQANP